MRSLRRYFFYLRFSLHVLIPLLSMSPVQAQSQINSGELGAVENQILLLWGEGKIAETVPLRKRAVALAEKTLGFDHPQTIKHAQDLGHVLKILGRLEEAKAAYERAMMSQERQIAAKKNPTLDELSALAALYQYCERYAKAETLYKQILAAQEKTLSPTDIKIAKTQAALADVYNAQGRWPEELLNRKRAVAIREKGRSEDIIVRMENVAARNLLIETYEALGRYPEGEALARHSLTALAQDKSPVGGLAVTNLFQLGHILASEENYFESEKFYRRAVSAERKNPTANSPGPAKYFTLGYYLSSWAETLVKLGRNDEAEIAAREALPIFRLSGAEDHFTAEVLTTFARVQQSRRRYDEAEKLFQRALVLQERFRGAESTQAAHALGDLATLKLEEGNGLEAYELAKRATSTLIRQVRRHSETLTMTANGHLRPGSFFHQPTFAVYQRAVADLATRSPERRESLAAESFEIAQWAQHSQAAAALSQMAARFSKGEGELTDLIRRRQDLVIEYRAIEKTLIAALSMPGQGSPSQGESRRKSSEAIENQIDEIDAILVNKFPNYAALANPQALSAKEVQAGLQATEAVVQFFIDEKQTLAWVVTRDAVRWQSLPLGASALANEVAALRCGLDNSAWAPDAAPKPGSASAQSQSRCSQILGASGGDTLPFDLGRAHALYVTLLGPFDEQIKDKQLLFVPSGPLTTLPLQVLVTRAPDVSMIGTEAYVKAAWLGLRQPITVLPSVSSLKSLRTAVRRSAAPNPFAGFANPLLTGTSGTDRSAWSRQTCAPVTPASQQIAELSSQRGAISDYFQGEFAEVNVLRRQPPLPETADEVCFVAKALGAAPDAVFLGAAASERKIKSLSASGALKSWRVLHFATHGLVAGETRTLVANRAEPALLLTPPEVASEEDDGLLTASEAANLRLDADWVILSACNTASTDGTPGAEALSGLASAFLYAGARSLVVSHWYINSEAAVSLITRMFGELARQPDISRGEAMRRSMKALVQQGGTKAHPSYWAPFVVVGENR
jgi:CHAT domain-containing protein/tetratricopeptide (TPR) repeat protein